jgi:myo-inositol-1(or 4)-monophosphatase
VNDLFDVAKHAVEGAGEIILSSYSNPSKGISYKDGNEITTRIDISAEKFIVDTILTRYPEHSIVSEESGEKVGNNIKWIIDPIDGTINFTRGLSYFSISIGVFDMYEQLFSLVFDPCRNELFYASKGEGAYLNGNRIQVATNEDLKKSVVITGFPFKNKKYKLHQIESLSNVFDNVMEIRRTGSAALDLAYIASGRFDGYWEYGVKSWDIAGGLFLVLEGGGKVTDIDGSDNYMLSGNIIAGNNKIHKELGKLLVQA